MALIAVLATSTFSYGAEDAGDLRACASGRAVPATAKTRLSQSKAIALASAAAKAQSINLAKYRQSSLCFDESRQQWTVFFQAAGPKIRVGDHFLVWVRDDTQATTLMWGE